jgi:hypothetical protein
VTPQSKQAKTPHTVVGVFALLRGLLHAKGSGASRIGQAHAYVASHIPPMFVTISGFLMVRYTAQTHTTFEVLYHLKNTATRLPAPEIVRFTLSTTKKVALTTFAIGSIGAVALPVAAQAAGAPYWRITDQALPTNVAPGGTGVLSLQVENVGDASSAANSPVTVVDRLPRGITASQASAYTTEGLTPEPAGLWGECEISDEGRLVSCTYQDGATVAPVSSSPGGFPGIGPHALAPPVGIDFSVESTATGPLMDTAIVSGGGASASATAEATVFVPASGEALTAPFGIASFHQWSANIGGTPATLAGSHPYETTTSLTFNTKPTPPRFSSVGVVRNIHLELPAGFVGNPNAIPKCPRSDFDLRLQDDIEPSCLPATQIGVASVTLSSGVVAQAPIYNLVPPTNVPAQFGLGLTKFVAFIDANVRPGAGGTYRLVADTNDIQTIFGANEVNVSLWGDPADPAHDHLRFMRLNDNPSDMPSEIGPKAFLSLPTSCNVPQTLTVSTNSWEDPLTVSFPGASSTDEQNNPVVMEGCQKLDFSPSLELSTEATTTSTPTAVDANIKVPQNEDPNGLSEADLKEATVTLPPSLTVSASAANGLTSCSREQIGVSGSGATLQWTESAPTCPESSRIGDLEVCTPLLEDGVNKEGVKQEGTEACEHEAGVAPLKGAVYLAQQGTVEGSLLGAYLVIEGDGVLVKQQAKVEVGGQAGVSGLQPGQVRATVVNAPQFPFSELKLHFFGGPRATIVTPATCGSYSAAAKLTGWNGAQAFPASEPAQSITGECSRPFAPSFTAGTTSNVAGAYSPLHVDFARADSAQTFGIVDVRTPPGLLGKLAGIPRCPQSGIEAAEHRDHPGEGALEISRPSCPAASEVGTVTVGAGPGEDPYYVTGREYLSGPYAGAPLSLDAITPALAGPFDLGVVLVRQALYVDPVTGQATVKSDPLPTHLEGVPLDVRSIAVDINHSDFIYNPTDCGALAATGSVTSSQGTVVPISAPFQATGCSAMPFKPAFSVSTQGNGTRKGNGASLTVKVTSKQGPTLKPGEEEANIKKVDVQLPIVLPARLTTIQKACLAATFEVNPAQCPAASVVGIAIAHTPVLNVPLEGPAILVSHGNQAFPDLVVVLQGEGITVQLTGNINIKKGITYNRFEALPDAPISSFELTVPEGPFSALSGIGNLCKPTKEAAVTKRITVRKNGRTLHQVRKVKALVPSPLIMPTTITGQNGSVLTQETHIAVTGCAKPKHVKKDTKARRIK